MFRSFSFVLFLLAALASSACATKQPCASQAVKAPGSPRLSSPRNSHASHPAVHLSLHDIVKNRQAVAPPPLVYKTRKSNERMSKKLQKLKSLGWELESVRDEMGRLASRVHKLGKREQQGHDASGQEIHDLLHHALEVFESVPSSIAAREIRREGQSGAIKPCKDKHDHRATHPPSASPVPSGRVKRATVTGSLTPISAEAIQHTLSRVLDSFSSTIELAASSLPLLPSAAQRSSIEALVGDLRWEMSMLLSDTQVDVPGLSLPDGY
ncbi:hypothetical protein JCM3766R1_000998 [Sporobolomyces carnicolor]